MIVCDPSQPVKVSRHFAAKLVVLNVEIPITKGFACVLHHGGVTEAATIKKSSSRMWLQTSPDTLFGKTGWYKSAITNIMGSNC